MPELSMTRRIFLGHTATAAGVFTIMPFKPTLGANAQDRQRIEQAIPTKAYTQPIRPRKLLIFDLNVGYGGHGSIPTANQAFRLMGQKTGAFETTVSRDPQIFTPDRLRQFDAVFLNNTVGNLFEDPELRQSLIEFVYGGGGLMGVHGTTVAFTRWPGTEEDWPEFGIMLGARGANHRDSDEHVYITLDDPNHPINQAFEGHNFEYRDEFFRVHEPYSRDHLRVLFSIDTDKTTFQGQPRGNCTRADNDYALAWIRRYGRGRVFYCTIAHNPYVFWDPTMLRFYLAATQFALGDLSAPTTPSAKLTPAIRAQEQLGWRLGFMPTTEENLTLAEAIDKAAELGVLYLNASADQLINRNNPKRFGPGLTIDEMRTIRLKLNEAGLCLLTLRINELPSNKTACRQLFEFARRMGVDTLIIPKPGGMLDTLETLCNEYDIKLAIDTDHNLDNTIELCRNRSKGIGVHADIGSWIQNNIDPVKTLHMLDNRLVTLDIEQANDLSPILGHIARLNLTPTVFGIQTKPGLERFNQAVLKLVSTADH